MRYSHQSPPPNKSSTGGSCRRPGSQSGYVPRVGLTTATLDIAKCCGQLACLLLIAMSTSVVFAQSKPDDFLRQMQFEAIETNEASWGRWGDHPKMYSSWTNHSNRLVPIYTFGLSLEWYTGHNSSYRSEELLTEIYGQLPEHTLDSRATYMDQTEIYFLQKAAAASGKKHIVLFIFDGMDWQTTWAAAIYKNKAVHYDSGYGQGLAFLSYDGCHVKDAADVVTSPHNNGTKFDVNLQIVSNPGGQTPGGYSPAHGGYHSWSKPASLSYLISKLRSVKHVYADSASSASSINSGVKTYNAAINMDIEGRPLEPIARQLQKKGFKIGVVTNVPISHATPAATYANNVSRDDYQDLTRDLIGLPSVVNKRGLPGVDVLIGCGWGETQDDDRGKQGDNFIPGNKYLAEIDLEKIDMEHGGKYVFAQRTPGTDGSQVLAQAAQQAVKNQSRLMGFFGHKGGHLPYQTADGNYDPTRGERYADRYTPEEIAENPTLEEMTEAALTVLGANGNDFWLMIEAGDLDWANHNNNIDDSIGALFSGEAAFEAVTRWIEKHSNWEESAVIVTADHGHLLVIDDPFALTGRIREASVEAENTTDIETP